MRENLSPGDKIALRYVEFAIGAWPDDRNENRRETADGWVLDETCSALTVGYRRISETEGELGFVFRRGR